MSTDVVDKEGLMPKRFEPEGETVDSAVGMALAKCCARFVGTTLEVSHSAVRVKHLLVCGGIVETSHPPCSPDLAAADFPVYCV